MQLYVWYSDYDSTLYGIHIEFIDFKIQIISEYP